MDKTELVDHEIYWLIRTWEGIPELAAEWDDWDENSQLNFIFDWPISRERLTRVRRLAEAGKLTPEQQARFEYVLRLVAEHGPTLERLIAD